MSDKSSQSALARARPSRVAAILLIVASVVTLLPGLLPHVIYRVPLALFTAWGLWQRQRWAYVLTIITAVVWLLLFVGVLPFLLVDLPWVIWPAWLYWLGPTALVVTAWVRMRSAAGRAERASWRRAD